MLKKGRVLKDNRGFTLIEVLVSSLIFVAVVAMGVSIFMATSGYRSKTKVMQQVNQVGRYAMEMITRDVKDASATVSDTNCLTSLTKTGFTFLNSAGCFKSSPVSPNGTDQLVVYRNGSDCGGNPAVAKIIYKKATSVLVREVTYPWNTATCGTMKETTYFNQPGVDAINFKISGDAPSSTSVKQPYVTVSMSFQTSGYSYAKSEERAEVSLQSTITSRLVDFK